MERRGRALCDVPRPDEQPVPRAPDQPLGRLWGSCSLPAGHWQTSCVSLTCICRRRAWQVCSSACTLTSQVRCQRKTAGPPLPPHAVRGTPVHRLIRSGGGARACPAAAGRRRRRRCATAAGRPRRRRCPTAASRPCRRRCPTAAGRPRLVRCPTTCPVSSLLPPIATCPCGQRSRHALGLPTDHRLGTARVAPGCFRLCRVCLADAPRPAPPPGWVRLSATFSLR